MNATETRLNEQLSALRLLTVQEQYAVLSGEAAQKQWPHVDYLARLIDGEARRRQEVAIQRRLAAARFPCLKTLDQFDWNWPKKINRPQVQNLFRLAFLPDKGNVVFMGGVGGQIAPGRRVGLCRLPGRPFRALHHGRGHHQYAHRRPGRLSAQSRNQTAAGSADFMH